MIMKIHKNGHDEQSCRVYGSLTNPSNSKGVQTIESGYEAGYKIFLNLKNINIHDD